MPHDTHCHDPNCGCGESHDHGPRPPAAHVVQPWRPRDFVRPIAIGIFRKDDRILAGPVHDDAGQIKGWRPLGGGISFGENAADTLRREITEETGQEIAVEHSLGALENIFDHHGTAGHEIVLVFAARFENAELYEADQIAFSERPGEELTAKWVSLDKARAGRIALYPEGLAELL